MKLLLAFIFPFVFSNLSLAECVPDTVVEMHGYKGKNVNLKEIIRKYNKREPIKLIGIDGIFTSPSRHGFRLSMVNRNLRKNENALLR